MLNTKHLTEQEVALCADAINGNTFNSLPEEIREHIAICDECASEVLAVAEVARELSAENKKGKQFKLTTGRIIALVTSAAAIIVFAVVFTNHQYKTFNSVEKPIASNDSLTSGKSDSVLVKDVEKTNQTSQKSQKDNIESEKPASYKEKTGELLASYEPNSELEKLYENYASEYRGDDISVISERIVRVPANDSLMWSNPSGEILNVDIFNNQGIRIITISSDSNGIKIPALNDGLYYWKLINQDFDLLFVGKILCEKR